MSKNMHNEIWQSIDETSIRRIQEIFEKLGTAQLSDANIKSPSSNSRIHRLSDNLIKRTPNIRLCGPVYPVNTKDDILPGLEAITKAPAGYVILLNNKTNSNKAIAGDIFVSDMIAGKLSGLIVYGAIRDIEEIRKLKLPVYSTHVNFERVKDTKLRSDHFPQTTCIEDLTIIPNDWLFGDEDGLLLIRKQHVAPLVYAAQLLEIRETGIKNQISPQQRYAKIVDLEEYVKGHTKLKYEG